MEAKAKARFVRVTPQKARRVVDLIRGRQAPQAIAVLEFAPQSASEPVLKVVNSAIANARVKAAAASEPFDERLLVVQEAYVDEVRRSSVSAPGPRDARIGSASGRATSPWWSDRHRRPRGTSDRSRR